MALAGSFIIAYAGIYIVCALIVAAGVRRVRTHPLPDELPTVSVVICARNEEEKLPRCLDAMLLVDYPRDRLEVILVDDESDDRTSEIMGDYARLDTAIRVLSTVDEPRLLPAKQRPLNMGIRESTGEFILITDADISVRPGWVRSHLAAYGRNIGIVGATTRIDTSSGRLYDRLQCCELLTKHAVAMGCVGLGRPLSIMGNNISFRRVAYDQIGGLMGMNHSVVEDMAMMNAVVDETEYTLNWVASREGVVLSTPETDLATFINQRFRWIFEVTDLSGIGKLMMLMEGLMLTSFIGGIVLAYNNWLPLAAATIAWCAGYSIMLWPSPGRERGDLWYVPATLGFQLLEIVLLAWRKLFGSRTMVWKGREYRKNPSVTP